MAKDTKPEVKEEVKETTWKDNFHTNTYTFASEKEKVSVQALITNELCKQTIQGQIQELDEILAVEDVSDSSQQALKITTRYGWLNGRVIEYLKGKVNNSNPGILLGPLASAVNEFIKWNG